MESSQSNTSPQNHLSVSLCVTACFRTFSARHFFQKFTGNQETPSYSSCGLTLHTTHSRQTDWLQHPENVDAETDGMMMSQSLFVLFGNRQTFSMCLCSHTISANYGLARHYSCCLYPALSLSLFVVDRLVMGWFIYQRVIVDSIKKHLILLSVKTLHCTDCHAVHITIMY